MHATPVLPYAQVRLPDWPLRLSAARWTGSLFSATDPRATYRGEQREEAIRAFYRDSHMNV